jgi:hypothetical protein
MHTRYSRGAFLAITLLSFPCLLTVAGCTGGKQLIPDANIFSGIQGQAMRGLLTPVTQQGQTNDAPLPGAVITILTPKGSEVTRQTTDSQGNYKINLAAGTYQVQGLAPSGSQIFPLPPAVQTVIVPVNQFVTVNLSYDTGIR